MDAPLEKPTPRRNRTSEIEALFMSIGDGVIATDSNARINRINQVALDILGAKENDLLGKWFPEVIKAEDEQGNELTSVDRPMGQAFLLGKTVNARTYYRRMDGERVPVSLSVSPVLVDERPIGAIEVFRDISHELELEHAKDEFVAIASHQLRTPATAVKQYVGLLLEGYAEPLTDSQRLFLERAYESNERQLQIVHEILKISQLDLQKVDFKPAQIDIVEVTKKAVDGLKSKFEQRHQAVIFKLPTKPVMGLADAEQLRTAIENLLENAANYTWEGKQITVSVRENKHQIKISIKDQGVGIASKDMPRLFQKFVRLPNSLSVEAGGTGLGLYWASKIVGMHGGTIKIDSAPKKGSTFIICLPKATEYLTSDL